MSATATKAQPRPTSIATDLAYIAVFAALIAAMSLMPAIPVGGLGVPITLQTLAISLTGLVLGWRAPLAVLLWIVVGVAGLPVFSGGKSGIGVLLGVTGGYIISFVIAALVVGLVTRYILRKGLDTWSWVPMLLTLIIVRLAVIWPIGVAGIARAAGKPLSDVWLGDMVFWPGDLIKSIVAVIIATAIFKAFPRLLRR